MDAIKVNNRNISEEVGVKLFNYKQILRCNIFSYNIR